MEKPSESPLEILESLRVPTAEEQKLLEYGELHALWAENYEALLEILTDHEVPFFGMHGSPEPNPKKLIGQNLHFASLTFRRDPEKILTALSVMGRYVIPYTIKGQGWENVHPGCVVLINLTAPNGACVGDRQPLNHDDSLSIAFTEDTEQQRRFANTNMKRANVGISYDEIRDPRVKNPFKPYRDFLGSIDGEILKKYFSSLPDTPENFDHIHMAKRLFDQKIVIETLKLILADA